MFCWRPSIGCWFSGGQAEDAGSAGGQAEAAGTAGKALGHAVEAALEGPGTAGQDSHCTLHRWIEGRLASMVCGTCGN